MHVQRLQTWHCVLNSQLKREGAVVARAASSGNAFAIVTFSIVFVFLRDHAAVQMSRRCVSKSWLRVQTSVPAMFLYFLSFQFHRPRTVNSQSKELLTESEELLVYYTTFNGGVVILTWQSTQRCFNEAFFAHEIQTSINQSINQNYLGIAIPGSRIPGSRTVFQSRNPGIMRDQIPGFRD